MKGQNKYFREIFIDGRKTSFAEIAAKFDITPVTANNLYGFDADTIKTYRGHKLTCRWVKAQYTFNINGHMTDNWQEACKWLGLGSDTLYTYIKAYPRGWQKNGNVVSVEMKWIPVERTTLKKHDSQYLPLYETPATFDVIEYKGVKIVRQLINDTLIKSYGWSEGANRLTHE